MTKDTDCQCEYKDYPDVDPKLVQIGITRQEMNRRISAFIDRKRKEVDDRNIQEFCGNPVLDSCARVDACRVLRYGGKSRFKVIRVEHPWGPQTRARLKKENLLKLNETTDEPQANGSAVDISIEERLRNMESHLKLKSCGQTVHERLQTLENRILFLEGLSPEYFTTIQKNIIKEETMKWNDLERKYRTFSMNDIDKRMEQLRDSLQQTKQGNETQEPPAASFP